MLTDTIVHRCRACGSERLRKNGRNRLPALADTLLPCQEADVLELDEMWGFVQSKANQLWLWMAVCRRTQQVVAYTLGDRGEDSARWLAESIPEFDKATRRLCAKQDGQTCRVENANGILRQRLGRLVRRTLSFSRCERAHELVLRWFLSEHNLRNAKSIHI